MKADKRAPLGSCHLGFIIFFLVLTVYPSLLNNFYCLVSAYSADDFDLKHLHIDKFDIIEVNDIIWSRPLTTRSTLYDGEQQLHVNSKHDSFLGVHNVTEEKQSSRKIQFTSLGIRFSLILTQAPHLVTHDFNIIALDRDGKETRVPYKQSDLEILNGYVDGERNSSMAAASFNKDNKLITAHIKTGQDFYVVEPFTMHKDSLRLAKSSGNIQTTNEDNNNPLMQSLSTVYNNTMIVYNLRDHKQYKISNSSSDSNHYELLCSGLNLNEHIKNNTTTTNDGHFNEQNPHETSTSTTRATSYADNRVTGRNRRGIEFWSDQSSKDKTRCTLHLVADYLFYKHIGNSDVQTTINYILALVNRVNQIYLSTYWETGDDNIEKFTNIGFSVQNITIHQDYTRLSSGDDHYNMYSDKVWAAREFLDNFSRYSPPKHYCLAHLLTSRQFDSPVLGLAYVASTRYGTIGGICSPTQQKGDAFYKHNTGISTSIGTSGEKLITRQADLVVAHELGHNLGAEHDANDCRPSPAKGGAYLMHPFAVMGFEKNNRFLSQCSRLAIGRVIRRKGPSCFVSVLNHVCGNGIVEDNEECDGGGIGYDFSDPCCDSSCRFVSGAQCSDRQSLCCSKCRIAPAGIRCRPAEGYNCKEESFCDGRSADCPASPPVEDNRVCVGRGVCRRGECTPFCDSQGMYSCLCNNPKDACKLCCQSSPNSTCSPFDNQAPHLPDGLICYRGVCEKGRCEQPIQDVVERLWDILEDINATTFVKFLRDNIIFVVLLVSIPLWCIMARCINEFDRRIKEDVMKALARQRLARRRLPKSSQSAFLPQLFVVDSEHPV